MKLTVFSSFLVVGIAQFTISTKHVGGCSSHCSVIDDSALECFNRTSKYFATTVLGIMRNWLVSQVDLVAIKKFNGKPVPTVEEMVASARKSMSMDKPLGSENEKHIYSVDQASKVVELLARKAKDLFSSPSINNGTSDVVCPSGCEKHSAPFLLLFLISSAVNLVLLITGVMALLLTTRRQEKFAKREYMSAIQTSLPMEKKQKP